MQITLIEVPRLAFPLNHASNVVIAPLGIAYITASLEAAGNKVQVIDAVGEGMAQYAPFGPVYLRGLSFKEIVSRIDPGSAAIGLSAMFSCGWPATRALIREIKGAFPRTPLIMGGEHPTGMWELVLNESPVDIFEDLTTIVKRSWILDFAGEILRRGLRVTYQLPSGTRSEAINRETARLYARAGSRASTSTPIRPSPIPNISMPGFARAGSRNSMNNT